MQVMPVGFYDKQGNYTVWQRIRGAPECPDGRQILATAYDRETFTPVVMFNFRLTKEIGRVAELVHGQQLHARTSRWHFITTPARAKQDLPRHVFRRRTETARIGNR